MRSSRVASFSLSSFAVRAATTRRESGCWQQGAPDCRSHEEVSGSVVEAGREEVGSRDEHEQNDTGHWHFSNEYLFSLDSSEHSVVEFSLFWAKR
jgi:hypothetical protein